MNEYSIKDIALEFGVSERTVLRQIQTISDKLKSICKMKKQNSDKTTQIDESEEKFRTRGKMLEKLIEQIYQGEKEKN